MNDDRNVLLVTIGTGDDLYEDGRDAIRSLESGESVDAPATLTVADEARLGEAFNERTFRLLRVIRERAPESIRETARLVDRDVKNVHAELSMLEALGVIRFERAGRAKRPVFPYDDLVISPFGPDERDAGPAIP